MELAGQDRGVQVDLRGIGTVVGQAQDREDNQGDHDGRNRREEHVPDVREKGDLVDGRCHHRRVGQRGDLVAEVSAGDNGTSDDPVGKTLGPTDAKEGDADGGDGGPGTAGHHGNDGANDAGRQEEHLGTDNLDPVIDESRDHAAHRPSAGDTADEEENEGGPGNVGEISADSFLEFLPRRLEEQRSKQHADAGRDEQRHLARAEDGVAAENADVDGEQRDQDEDGNQGEDRRPGGGLFHIRSSYRRQRYEKSSIFVCMRRWFIALTAALSALTAAAQEYGVVDISVCNLRATPDYDAEMVSQALLGTPVHILQITDKNNWPQVQTPDTYTGWVHKDAITLLSFEEYHAWNAAPKIVVTALTGVVYAEPSPRSATVSDVVAGDRLKDLGRKGRFHRVGFPDGRVGYLDKKLGQPEAVWRASLDQSVDAILASALTMNGFPYLWAGMSPKGMDCSGFVRTVLFMHDIIIPRDAGPQSRTGERILGLEDLLPGDLVFFGRKDAAGPKVSHVGFYLGDGKFIHSLGLVKIGSFRPEDPEYDAYNTGRYLFASRVLPFIDKQEGLNTTMTNPYYSE